VTFALTNLFLQSFSRIPFNAILLMLALFSLSACQTAQLKSTVAKVQATETSIATATPEVDHTNNDSETAMVEDMAINSSLTHYQLIPQPVTWLPQQAKNLTSLLKLSPKVSAKIIT